MAEENEVQYQIQENGDATVSVTSKTPLKPRAIYIGEAKLEFNLVHTGKTTQWQFTPTILNPKPAQYQEQMDGQTQTINIEFGKISPASGLINTNVAGEIRAPAIQFDLPYQRDLWVIILQSPTAPLKVSVEKSLLSIAHTLAYATAQVEVDNTASDEQPALRTYVTMHGEGFTDVSLNLKRSTSHSCLEESFVEIKFGAASFSWKPTFRTFDVVLTTSSSMSESLFLDFLTYLGAEVQKCFFAKLKSEFLLCDGPAIKYTLSLKGAKRFIGTEQDKMAIKLDY
jgi:hypothetical protein